MVSACHTSKSEFCRLFKAAMHQTPFDFLLHYRIQKSLPLLCSTDQSVTEIAGCVGFSSSSYYSEVFRKFMQCSPTEYRRNNAAQPQAWPQQNPERQPSKAAAFRVLYSRCGGGCVQRLAKTGSIVSRS